MTTIRFAAEEERDYLAAEVLAAKPNDPRITQAIQADTVHLERSLGLAAGLLPRTDPLVNALLGPGRRGSNYRLWLAAEVIAQGRATERRVRRQLESTIQNHVPAVWAIDALVGLGDPLLLIALLDGRQEPSLPPLRWLRSRRWERKSVKASWERALLLRALGDLAARRPATRPLIVPVLDRYLNQPDPWGRAREAAQETLDRVVDRRAGFHAGADSSQPVFDQTVWATDAGKQSADDVPNGPTEDMLRAYSRHSDYYVKSTAEEALERLTTQPETEVIAWLRARLRDGEWCEQEAAATVVNVFPDLRPEFILDLVRSLSSGEHGLRRAAARRLGRPPSPTGSARDLLVRLVQVMPGPDLHLPCDVLVAHHDTGDDVVAALLARLDQTDDSFAPPIAARALGDLDLAREDVVERLLAHLRARHTYSGPWDVYAEEAISLGKLARRHDWIRDRLLAALDNRAYDVDAVRHALRIARGDIQP